MDVGKFESIMLIILFPKGIFTLKLSCHLSKKYFFKFVSIFAIVYVCTYQASRFQIWLPLEVNLPEMSFRSFLNRRLLACSSMIGIYFFPCGKNVGIRTRVAKRKPLHYAATLGLSRLINKLVPKYAFRNLPVPKCPNIFFYNQI